MTCLTRPVRSLWRRPSETMDEGPPPPEDVVAPHTGAPLKRQRADSEGSASVESMYAGISLIIASLSLSFCLYFGPRGTIDNRWTLAPNGSSLASGLKLTIITIVALFARLLLEIWNTTMKMAERTAMRRTICRASTNRTTTLQNRIGYPCNMKSLFGHSRAS